MLYVLLPLLYLLSVLNKSLFVNLVMWPNVNYYLKKELKSIDLCIYNLIFHQ